MTGQNDLLLAAKADQIPAGASGLWFIRKFKSETCEHINGGIVPAGTYTALFRITEEKLHFNPPGECVMEDTPVELKKHLDFMMRAKGRVLVTGLGLGCVVRGLLANPNVEHITCIEKSSDILMLVEPYMPVEPYNPPDKRLTIIADDAIEWTRKNRERFDYAWHDLWSNREAGEPHLDIIHTRLIYNCRDTIRYQGAWGYERMAKRLLKQHGIQVIG